MGIRIEVVSVWKWGVDLCSGMEILAWLYAPQCHVRRACPSSQTKKVSVVTMLLHAYASQGRVLSIQKSVVKYNPRTS